jgi:drug/metabolite transporter (DMT)-like permease
MSEEETLLLAEPALSVNSEPLVETSLLAEPALSVNSEPLVDPISDQPLLAEEDPKKKLWWDSWGKRLFSWNTLIVIVYTMALVGQTLLYKLESQKLPTHVALLDFVQPFFAFWQVGAVQLFRHLMWKSVERPDVRWRTLLWYLAVTVLIWLWVLGTRYGSRGDLVSGPIFTVITALPIPLTMLGSLVFLGHRYSVLHYIGGGLVLAAIPLSLMHLFLDPSSFHRNSAVALVVLILSQLPMAVYTVWSEPLLQSGRLDTFWLLFFISLFHTILAIPTFLLTPILVSGVPFTLSAIWANVRDGFTCFFAGTSSSPLDFCADAGFIFIPYSVFIIVYALLGLYIVRNMSASVTALANGAALPIASLLFSVSIFGGDPFSLWVILGVCLAFAGIVIYRIRPERVSPEAKCIRYYGGMASDVEEEE